MKQRFKVIVPLLLCAILLCAVFTACGTSEDDPVVGTWEMSKVSAMGQEMSAEEFLKVADYSDSDIPVITFKDDSTVSVDMMGNKGSGEWNLKDGTYLVTDDSNIELKFTLEDDTLSVEQSGAVLEFKKKEN